MLASYKGQLPKNGAGRKRKRKRMKNVAQLDSDRLEWMDLRRLTAYAAVSERTTREWIHRPENPLPAVRVGTKLLVRRSTLDRWLEAHQVKQVDVGCMVEEILAGVAGPN